MALLGNLTGSAPFFNPNRFYNDIATQSLRLDDGSSAYLSRTPASAGNRKTWTWSGWVKRSNLGATHTLFDSRPTGEFAFGFLSGDTFYVASSSNFRITNQVFRDVSSWYHFVVVLDTTQATGSNRIKVYVNGNQITSFGTSADPSQNAEFGVNFTQLHSLGRYTSGGYFDGYMAEVNLIDGQALDPTYFGEFKNGVWIAKRYTGSYGTNGFRLQFNQTGTGSASSSTIGADTSGNANHFSSSGIVASDCDMPDSPENNFPTWNPIAPDPTYGITTFSEGNLKSLNSPANNKYSEITFRLDQTNKYYFEYYNITTTGALQPASFEIFASSSNKVGFYITTAGYITLDGAIIGSGFPTLSAGDIMNIAFDGASGKVWFGKNGTYYNASGSATGNPADGTNPIATVTSAEFKMTSVFYQQGAIMNFGQDSTFAGGTTAGGNTDDNGIGDFKYSVPSGYLALCTANLPEPTISPNADEQADDYFNTVLYTGNGSTQSINVGFAVDFAWLKRRDSAGNHFLLDTVRGATKQIYSDLTLAEETRDSITSFSSTGYDLGNYVGSNGSAYTMVAWNWKAGGTAVSNTDGSITSSVSANTDAGFSIVSYTGTGANATVGHELGKKPKIIIVKNRDDSSNWAVFSEEAGNGYWLLLNESFAKQGTTTMWNSTSPTSTVFSVGSANESNGSGDNLIAYCFAEIDGYSKFGSYTGNGSTDGTFVYTGFRPAFIIVKTTSGANWETFDTTRSPSNVIGIRLFPSLSNAENTGEPNCFDILSNGFKARGSYAGSNISGEVHIYMAFAENPFKYANAR